MEFQIVDKETLVVSTERKGLAAEVYAKLHGLMVEQPGKKAVVPFKSANEGLRAQQRMAEWAAVDGLELFSSVVRGTAHREMYLEPVKEDVNG